jgi:hypothetical protein
LNEVAVQEYYILVHKSFRSVCTHKVINESQKEISTAFLVNMVWFTSVKLAETFPYVLKNPKRNCEKSEQDKLAVDKHSWIYDHRIK